MKHLSLLLLTLFILSHAHTASAAESLTMTAPKLLPREHGLSAFSPVVRLRLTGLEPGQEYVVRLWLLEAESGSYHLASTQSPWAFRIQPKDDTADITHVEAHDVFGHGKFLYVARLFRAGTELASDTQPAAGLAVTPPALAAVERVKVKAGETARFQASARASNGLSVEYRGVGLPPGATVDAKTGEFRWLAETPGSYRFAITATQPNGLADAKKVHLEVTE